LRRGLLAEKKNRPACDNAIVMAQLDCLDALAIYRSSILRFKVLQDKSSSIAADTEMQAGEGIVTDANVGGLVPANGKRLLADAPALCHQTVIAQ